MSKFYIAQPKTPLDNHTEQIEQHIRKLFLHRLDKPEVLKKIWSTKKNHHKQTQQLKINKQKQTE